jgi:hypothetical protein
VTSEPPQNGRKQIANRGQLFPRSSAREPFPEFGALRTVRRTLLLSGSVNAQQNRKIRKRTCKIDQRICRQVAANGRPTDKGAQFRHKKLGLRRKLLSLFGLR